MPDTPWNTNPATSGQPVSGGHPTSPALDLPMDPFGGGTADTPHAPPQWTRPGLGGGYPAALDDSRREIVIPAADGPVTIAYGRVRVAPVVELLHTHLGNLDYAVLVWCLGEIEEVEEVSFGADPGTDDAGNGLDEPTVLASYTGSLTQTAYSSLTSMSTLADGWPFALPGKAYSVVRATQGQDISLLNSARAIVQGLKVYDPRTSATTAAADRIYSRNPALLAGTLFAAEWGMGAGYDAVDWDRIEDAADYCDVSVNGEPRFAVDVWSRQGMSLKTWLNTLALHCRGYWGRSNGLWYFDVRRPASSTFVFSDRLSLPTIAPESVRVTTRSRTKEPSSLVVDWLDTDSWQMGVPLVLPNPRTTFGLREARIQLPWCTSRSMAKRIATYELGQRTKNPARVTWTAPDAAQAVQVGDVVTVSVDTLLDEVEVEVEQIRRDGGALQFVGSAYAASKFGDVHVTPDIPPVVIPPGMGLDPDLPTAVNQEFIAAGNWSGHNLLPDESHLAADWSTSTLNLTDTTSGSGIDWTLIGCASGAGDREMEYEIDHGDADTLFLTLLSAGEAANEWRVRIVDSADAVVGDVVLVLDGDLRSYQLPVSLQGFTGPFRAQILRASGEYADSLFVTEFYVVASTFRPGLSLLERWTWTEHANAANTVRRYELIRKFTDGQSQVLASVPVGSTSLQAATYSGGALWGGGSWNLLDGSVIRMRAVGLRGRMVEFDADTQSVGTLILGDVTGDLRDMDTTDRATGKVAIWNATTEKHEYADVYTETEVDTLLGGKVSDTGDAMSGNLEFNNNVGVQCKGTGGTLRDCLKIDDSNVCLIGTPNHNATLRGLGTRPAYNAVDLALKSDSDAAIQKALVTTKGDLIAATAASTPARLAIGATDGYPLVVASAQAAGMQWARMALAALADQAQATLVGRAAGAGTGAPSALTATQGRTLLGLGALAVLDTVGTAQIDATAVGTTQIATDAVTNARLANMTEGTVKLRTRAAGTGDPEDGGASDVIAILAGGAYTGDTETGLRLLVCDGAGDGVGYVDIDIRGGVVTAATYHAGFSA